jgi:VanZ family protein
MVRNKERVLIYRNILAIIYLLLIALFAYFCMQNGEDSSNTSSFISDFICSLFNITRTDEISAFLRKAIGHFGFFMMFSFVSCLLFMTFYKWKYHKQLIVHFSLGISYILITEFLFQAIAINRGPSFKDCLIDFGGFLLMSIIVIFIFYIYRLAKSKNLNENKRFMLIYSIITGSIFSILVILYIILSLQNNKVSGEVGTSIGQTIVDVTPGISADITKKSTSVQQFIRKVIGHFGYFAIISLSSYLFMISLRNKINNKILIIAQISFGVIFALFTEFALEALASGRSPMFLDALTDSLGYVFMCIFIYLSVCYIKFIYKIRFQNSRENV